MKENIGEQYQKCLIERAVVFDQQFYRKPSPIGSRPLKFLEIFFNLCGFLLGYFWFRLPSPKTANFFSSCMALYQTSGKRQPLSQQSLNNLSQTQMMSRRLLQEESEKLSVLVLASHPETSTAESHLLGQMVLESINFSKKYFPDYQFQLMQAVDSFALDMLPLTVKGIYAGVMACGHIPIDRQPYLRGAIQKFLFRRAHYRRTIYELLSSLKKERIVYMALGGGVLHNSKILYTIKEFAQELFFSLPVTNRSKRLIEMEFSQFLVQKSSKSVRCGNLSQEEKTWIYSYMKDCGLPHGEADELMNRFEDELARETPYRLRLMRVLMSRLCARGHSLLLVPLRHDSGGGIAFFAPRIVRSFNPKNMELVWVGAEGLPYIEKLDSFVKSFVSLSFH